MSNSKGVIRLWGLYTILNGEGERGKGSGKTNDLLRGWGERAFMEDKWLFGKINGLLGE